MHLIDFSKNQIKEDNIISLFFWLPPKKMMLSLIPVMCFFHYYMVYGIALKIGIQGAFIGIFTIGVVAWFLGIFSGSVMAAMASILTSKIFFSLGILSHDSVEWTRAVVGIGGYLTAAIVIGYISRMHSLLKTTKKELQNEYDNIEKLMSNILPDSISRRLRNGESLIADRYDEASVLFCDIVGFTAFTKNNSPEKMVTLLNDLISSFDVLASSLSLEKIKTIGDAYLVAGGLPEERNDHAGAIAAMAIGMLKVVAEFNEKHNLDFQVRIGIHSGPVIGGVIGRNKFTFDIWGDTVNVASRLESQGIPGKIQVSGKTRSLLKNQFKLEERGSIDIRNRGVMKTWLLKG